MNGRLSPENLRICWEMVDIFLDGHGGRRRLSCMLIVKPPSIHLVFFGGNRYGQVGLSRVTCDNDDFMVVMGGN